jgi:hypothetical protein
MPQDPLDDYLRSIGGGPAEDRGFGSSFSDLYDRYSEPFFPNLLENPRQKDEDNWNNALKYIGLGNERGNLSAQISDPGNSRTAKFLSYANPMYWQNKVAESMFGSPIGLAETASTALGFGLAGKVGRVASNVGRGLSGLGAAAGVPKIAEGISEGDAGKAIAGTLQTGLGTVGAFPNKPSRLPNIIQAAPPTGLKQIESLKPESFILSNPTPRNVGRLADIPEYKVGEFDPTINNRNFSAGRQVKGVDPQGPIRTVKLEPQAKNPDEAFQNWVGDRQATGVEANLVRKQFSKYDQLGEQGLLDYYKNPKKFGDLQKYFDDKYQTLAGSDKKIGYKTNYLPQLWEDPDAAAQVFGKTLSKKASFEFNSVIKNYEAGIAMGLTPKYKNLGELAAWYEQSANKAIADKEFLDYLKGNKAITTSKKAGYTLLNPEFFPAKKFKIEDKIITQNYYAPDALATKINSFLGPVDDKSALGKVADFSSGLKSFFLTGGIPKTGINMHGVSILARSSLASDNPVSGFLTGAHYLANPKAAGKYLDENLSLAPQAVRSGLKLSVEDVPFGARPKPAGVIGKAQETLKTTFEDPLFQQVIPALKLQHWRTIRDDLARNMTPDVADKEASKVVNNLFGSINIEQLGRSKETQNLMRAVFLAPQWLESQAGVGKGIAKALMDPSDPKGRAYQNIARNLGLALASANVTNKLLSGHYLHENETGKAFAIDTGQKDSKGKIIYLNPFGTGIDFARLPYDAALAISKGDLEGASRLVTNRVGPVPRTAISMAANKNWRGQKIMDPKDAGKTAQNLVREGLEFAPPIMQSPVDYMLGNVSPLEGFTSAFELPVSYRKPYDPNGKKKRKNVPF